jgi:prepilin peptidase CpaA
VPESAGVVFTIHLSFLFALLFVAAVTDLLHNRIANRLVAAGIIAAVIFALIENQLAGFLTALGGASAGFSIFFLLYILGGVGAGDTKLMTAVGALTSWRFVLWSTFFTALAGVFVVLNE